MVGLRHPIWGLAMAAQKSHMRKRYTCSTDRDNKVKDKFASGRVNKKPAAANNGDKVVKQKLASANGNTVKQKNYASQW